MQELNISKESTGFVNGCKCQWRYSCASVFVKIVIVFVSTLLLKLHL